jgi:hypothetical protein
LPFLSFTNRSHIHRSCWPMRHCHEQVWLPINTTRST